MLIAGRPRFMAIAAELRTSHPHVVVIVDGGDGAGSDHLMTEGGVEGVTVVDLVEPAAPAARPVDAGARRRPPMARSAATTFEGRNVLGRADSLTAAESEALALHLAPLRLSQASRSETSAVSRDLAWPSCWNSATRRRSTWPAPGRRGPTGTGCASRSASPWTAPRSTSTSRSPRRTGWARTGC